MPWRVRGRTVQKKVGGKWKKKATAKSPASAGRMKRLLYAVEHGFVPRKGKRRATRRRR